MKDNFISDAKFRVDIKLDFKAKKKDYFIRGINRGRDRTDKDKQEYRGAMKKYTLWLKQTNKEIEHQHSFSNETAAKKVRDALPAHQKRFAYISKYYDMNLW